MEVVLFPGRVRLEAGSVTLPVESFKPDQNVVPRFALSNVNVLGLPCAALLFQVNETLETITECARCSKHRVLEGCPSYRQTRVDDGH